MSIGRLGFLSNVTTSKTMIYTVPTGKVACVDINVCQTVTTATLEVYIYVGNGTAFDELLRVVQISATNKWHTAAGILMNAGEKVTVSLSATANVNCTVRGIEEDNVI